MTLVILAHSVSSPDALLLLHSTILEPDLYLFLRQLQTIGDLNAAQAGQVYIVRKLSFQLQQLFTAERGPGPLDA